MLEQAELRFEMKAGPTGSLFGSVTATDIADELWEKHKVRVDRRKIELPQPIKQVGRYAMPVGIFEDVQARGGDARRPRGRRAAAAEPEERPPRSRRSRRRPPRSRPVEEQVEEPVEEPAAEAPELVEESTEE